MPSLIDLRRRIRAVRNTQQITKAMKMVASSRLRRAQERMLGARPFTREMVAMIRRVAARVDPSAHPLLAPRDDTQPGARIVLVVITADKGLCGSFNTNVIKEASRFITERPGRQVSLVTVGRRGRDFFRRRGMPIIYERVNLFTQLSYTDAQVIAAVLIDAYTAGDVDGVYVVANTFKSMLQQLLRLERLLPIASEAFAPTVGPRIDYLYEPEAGEIFKNILPGYVHGVIWQALLESAAAEHAARMTAMDAATKNAGEVIDSLTLYMNKVRQANITREIIEVVSGAEAL